MSAVRPSVEGRHGFAGALRASGGGANPDAPWVLSTARQHAHLAGFDLLTAIRMLSGRPTIRKYIIDAGSRWSAARTFGSVSVGAPGMFRPWSAAYITAAPTVGSTDRSRGSIADAEH
jgi:hypothetical protein